MHIFFYLMSIAIFSSKIGKSKEVFSDGKFKEFEVGISLSSTFREPFNQLRLVSYDNR